MKLHSAIVLAAIVPACAYLAGCASQARPLAFAPIDASDVVVADYLPPGSTMLGRVSVVKCYNQITSEAPANGEMLLLLEQQAASIGGNLLRNVQYGSTGVLTRCSVAGGKTATAVAYRGTWRSF